MVQEPNPSILREDGGGSGRRWQLVVRQGGDSERWVKCRDPRVELLQRGNEDLGLPASW